MADTTVLVMGCTGGASWARDEIFRLSGQARGHGVKLVGADTLSNLRTIRAEELSCFDSVVSLDVYDADACRAWAATGSGVDAVFTIRELAVFPTAVIAQELSILGND